MFLPGGRLLQILVFLLASTLLGRDPAAVSPQADLDRLERETVERLAQYLRLDTGNPPGNEMVAARFLADILSAEGIAYRIVESSPGRGNLYARLEGTGEKPALVLLHHMDVVPAESEGWSVPPFAGIVRDDHVWGRGALDAKSLGVAQLMAFLTLKRSGLPLNRDVVFLATADEEAGGAYGVEWLLTHHPELFKGVGYVLTEGGTLLLRGGRPVYVGIETTQKLPLWIRMRVVGSPGHGAYPRGVTASARLVRALDRVLRYRPPVRVSPPVAEYFRSIAPLQPSALRESFQNLEAAVRDPLFVARLGPAQQSLLRNTLVLTVLRAGDRTNVIPVEAVAELDCRLLPDEDPETFVRLLERLVNDPLVEITTMLKATPASSSLRTELFESVRRATAELHPEARVGPAVLAGFTDSRFFRTMGITAYGFNPFPVRNEVAATVHGHDERIPIEALKSGTRFLYRVVAEFVDP